MRNQLQCLMMSLLPAEEWRRLACALAAHSLRLQLLLAAPAPAPAPALEELAAAAAAAGLQTQLDPAARMYLISHQRCFVNLLH